MGTSVPWQPAVALVLLHGGDTDGDQEEPGQALPAGIGRDMVAHSATPSQHLWDGEGAWSPAVALSAASPQHSQDGEGTWSPTLSTPSRQGCSRPWWAEV